MVDKAQAEIQFLSMELQIQIRITGNKHVDTALARYNLGRALRLSNKTLETTQAVDEFQAAISFLKQREPKHHSLISFEKAREQERDCARKRDCQITLFIALFQGFVLLVCVSKKGGERERERARESGRERAYTRKRKK